MGDARPSFPTNAHALRISAARTGRGGKRGRAAFQTLDPGRTRSYRGRTMDQAPGAAYNATTPIVATRRVGSVEISRACEPADCDSLPATDPPGCTPITSGGKPPLACTPRAASATPLNPTHL